MGSIFASYDNLIHFDISIYFRQDFDSQRKGGKLFAGISPHWDRVHHVGGGMQPVGLAAICHPPQQRDSYAHVYLVRATVHCLYAFCDGQRLT